MLTITLHPRRIAAALTAVAAILVALSAAVHVAKRRFEARGPFLDVFDADLEQSLATWVSCLLLLAVAVLLGVIAAARAQEGDRFRRHWLALAVLAGLASLSEVAMLHERVGLTIGPHLQTTGFLYHAWVIPASVLVVIVALTFLRFLLHQPPRTRLLFLLAGGLYVGGALGMEFIGASINEQHGPESLRYTLLTDVEEFLEMLGAIVAIYALLGVAAADLARLRLRVAGTDEGAGTPTAARVPAPEVVDSGRR
jgi:hypothetical protein